MTDHIEINRRNWDERASIHSRDSTGDYMLGRFRAGEDAHPGFCVLEEHAGKYAPTYDYQTPPDRPLQFVTETTYTGDPTVMSHQSTREWIHSLSAVLGGLIEAGLTITMFREHDVLPWQGLRSLVPATDRLWRLPDGVPRIPLSYSVRAKKGA